jgi:hypothetical protein
MVKAEYSTENEQTRFVISTENAQTRVVISTKNAPLPCKGLNFALKMPIARAEFSREECQCPWQ